MKSPVFLSAMSIAAATSLLLISGCASVAETSNTASVDSNKCKVVLAQPARINYDSNKATDLDKNEARAKLAALELKKPPSRTMAGNNLVDQALRDCM